MKKLSREEENELRGQDPEAYLQYYYPLRERFEASVLYNLSLKTRKGNVEAVNFLTYCVGDEIMKYLKELRDFYKKANEKAHQ